MATAVVVVLWWQSSAGSHSNRSHRGMGPTKACLGLQIAEMISRGTKHTRVLRLHSALQDLTAAPSLNPSLQELRVLIAEAFLMVRYRGTLFEKAHMALLD